MSATEESRRLAQRDAGTAAWDLWGPYLAERQWGTVREDYSPDGAAWTFFPHEHARSRAYRWGEDGLAGVSDDQQRLCLALALWNGRDPILKERLFGLSGPEGNHGEDVKEYYWYLDSTPTHSYMRMLYKYPQAPFPYDDLVETNARRGKDEREYELIDTGSFAADRYWDVFVEYAKAAPDDVLMRVRAINRGPEAATLHLLPMLWFRNTWSWGLDDRRPTLAVADAAPPTIVADHDALGHYRLACEGADALLFTENETNAARLWGTPNASPYVKDAFHDYVVHGQRSAVSPDARGTKAAAYYRRTARPGEEIVIRLRLTATDAAPADPFADFDAIIAARQVEADAFYAGLLPEGTDDEARMIHRQALAGMLWSKQFYYFVVRHWLDGDPGQPAPPRERRHGRNGLWRHLEIAEIISMPDKWEYPWFAAWDLAFHCVPLALVDPAFAKRQLGLLLDERRQHPNGQIPAYEWAFGDINPPVIAWLTYQIFRDERERTGKEDRAFLESCFLKMLLDFTWWVNRKDAEGDNIFGGGFLGMDNIGVFDRSAPLPNGAYLEQSDGTSWVAVYCLAMLRIALTLAVVDPVYERIATKFLEHFLDIIIAMHNIGGDGLSLWDDEDRFYYDVLRVPGHGDTPVRIRSFVGLVPLFASVVATMDDLALVPAFRDRLMTSIRERLDEHIAKRPDLTHLTDLAAHWDNPKDGQVLLAICTAERLRTLLTRALDEGEFLSPYGMRALSRHHREHPYVLQAGDGEHVVRYEPAESSTGMFGGNSNWRGPIWFPVNYLFIESLRRFYRFHGPEFTVECPTGSGRFLTLDAVADELSDRLIAIFRRGPDGRRPVFGGQETFQRDPHWRDNLLFYEYFHGDNGAGIGANHQTGWTGLVAMLVHAQAQRRAAARMESQQGITAP